MHSVDPIHDRPPRRRHCPGQIIQAAAAYLEQRRLSAGLILSRGLARHLATVAQLKPQRFARAPLVSFDAWSSARTLGVVRAEP